MLKKAAVAGAMALAVIVLAQGVALIGARGQGAAAAPDGRVAEFRFAVSKLTSEPPRLEGQFAVQIGGGDHRGVSIELRQLRNVAIGGPHRNVCEFGGPAVMKVRTPRGVETIQGALSARVVDNRRQRLDGDGGDATDGADGGDHARFDVIELAFHTPEHPARYTFAGRVRRGDIAVFVRTR